MMKRLWLVVLVWVCAGAGAVAGSILGNAFGGRGLSVGAVLGGALATLAAVRLAGRLRLLAPGERRAAATGGLLGFAAAAYLAATNLHTPVIPILATSLTGLGALLGALYLAGREPATFPTEPIVNRDSRAAIAGLVLVLPALVLVSGGLLELDVPGPLVHPVLVIGGLAAAFAVNALAVLRVRFGRDEESVVGTVSLRVHGSGMNLAVMSIGILLFAVIAAYLFVENFQPR